MVTGTCIAWVEMENAYKTLVGKCDRKRQLGRPQYR
jgi:hypothetical protein